MQNIYGDTLGILCFMLASHFRGFFIFMQPLETFEDMLGNGLLKGSPILFRPFKERLHYPLSIAWRIYNTHW
jgi:hypothetical protein